MSHVGEYYKKNTFLESNHESTLCNQIFNIKHITGKHNFMFLYFIPVFG